VAGSAVHDIVGAVGSGSAFAISFRGSTCAA
jgi:hypothetical protein